MSLQEDILDSSRLRLTGNFNSQVTYLLENIRLTRGEVEHLTKLFEDLERTLSCVWPGCQVHPFGSIVTGLGIRTSDVDCYVSLPNWDRTPPGKVVMKAKNIIARQHAIYTEIFAIPAAKVPIVKFFHIPTGRHCDVNFKSPAGVENSKLVAYLLHLDDRALRLVILIKYWAKLYSLTGTNLMSNYSLTMLVIFYLQQVNILPPVFVLQRSVPIHMIDNWNTAFQEIDFTTNNSDSLCELMGGFFDYYTNFDFEGQIVSTFIGCPINKNLFKNLNDIPDEFELYKENVTDKVCKQFKIDAKMCVQDPFEHARNCSLSIFPKLAIKLAACFQSASKMFKEYTNNDFLKQVLTSIPNVKETQTGPKKKKSPSKVIKQKAYHQKLKWKNLQNNIQTLYGDYNKIMNMKS